MGFLVRRESDLIVRILLVPQGGEFIACNTAHPLRHIGRISYA